MLIKYHTSGLITLSRKSVHPSTSSGRTDLLLQHFDESLYPLYFIESHFFQSRSHNAIASPPNIAPHHEKTINSALFMHFNGLYGYAA